MTTPQQSAASEGQGGATGQLIDADLDTVGLRGTFALYSLADRAWLYGSSDDRMQPAADFGTSGYVAVMGNSQHLVETLPGSSAPDWLEVLSFVQDSAIDELGFGWPELYDSGRFLAVLGPGWSDDQLVWTRAGQPLVAVGALAEALPGSLSLGH